MRSAAFATGALTAVLLAMPADAAAGPLGMERCAPVEGLRQCSGLVRTWDGVPLDTTVTLPADGGSGLPLVVLIHGFGNSKSEYLGPPSASYTDTASGWARDGYAVLTYTARGLWSSCGTLESRLADPAGCARGYIHLADHRYEVRDTQELVGRLVDEGLADPDRIGVTGDSYGGGQSFALAALADRTMLPDGRLVPWISPQGTPLRLAAAAPVIPWTDLVSAIAPNGRTLTHTVLPGRDAASPVGVEKGSFAVGIFASATLSTGPGQPTGDPQVTGRPMGFLAPPATDPEADVTAWVLRATFGDPYDGPYARRLISRLERYHSAYRIPPTEPPPLFVASGSTDDLFPVDEATRFLNRMARDHPDVPQRLLWGDIGHQRAANKPPDRARLTSAIHAWFDRYVRGDGQAPPTGVTATTQTCPRAAPSEGPYSAASFRALAAGEVGHDSASAQTVLPLWGNPLVAAAIDPVLGGGDACATTDAGAEPGTATYLLPPAAGGGYTLLGAPTVTARVRVIGARRGAQIASRLWDVGPGGRSQTLVARGAYRPTDEGREVWQLHPAAWRFAPGHRAKLELLGADMPFARFSNLPFLLSVSDLELRLPVREAPDGAAVLSPTEPVVPAGHELAPRP